MGGGGWGLLGRGGEVTEGWGLAIEIVMVGWVLEDEAGCKCFKCHLEMKEAVAAWRKCAGVSCGLARARLVMKAAVSSLQRPPTSIQVSFFDCTFFSDVVWLELFYSTVSRHVPLLHWIRGLLIIPWSLQNYVPPARWSCRPPCATFQLTVVWKVEVFFAPAPSKGLAYWRGGLT